MKNQLIMSVVFVLLALYGAYIAVHNVISVRSGGFITGRGVIVDLTESQRRGTHTGPYDHNQIIRFTYDDLEYTITESGSGVARRDQIGREIGILIHTGDPMQSRGVSLFGQVAASLGMVVAGTIGALINILLLRRRWARG